MGLSVLLLIGGLKIYANTHKEEVLKYKAKKQWEENEEPAKTALLITDTGDTDKYKKMLEALAPYEITREGLEEGDHDYDVPEEELKSLGLRSNGYVGNGKFFLDKDCVEELLGFYYDQQLKVTSEYYDGSVTVRRTGGRRELISRAYGSVSYSIKNTGGEEIQYSVYYDPVDRLVSEVHMQGDIEDARFFM